MKTLSNSFGYRDNLIYDDFLDAYKHIGIARRIIDVIVDFTWRTNPFITNSESIEAAIAKLCKKHKLFKQLKRADLLACIGRYSVILIATKDGDYKTEFARNRNITDITGLYVYSEKQAQIKTWNTDSKSPRYGEPETYSVSVQGETGMVISHEVHHSRIIHVADDLIDSDYYGTPKLEAVYCYIQDLVKLVGSSAEMFWLGAFQGLVAKIASDDKDVFLSEETIEQMKREFEEYSNNLRKRNMVVNGMDVTSLPSQTPDPRGVFEVLGQLLSTCGVPTRILFGSEQGQLAGETDRDMFLSNIGGRRETFAADNMLIPLIERLISYGYIESSEDYAVEWKPLIERTKSEKVEDGVKRITAMRSVVGQLEPMTAITSYEEIREMLELDPEVPESNSRPVDNYDEIINELPMNDKYIQFKRRRRNATIKKNSA